MKKVLVACGNGIATSTVVASKIEEYLGENNFDAKIDKTKLLEVRSSGNDYDLVVTTGNFDGELNVPIINGMSLLTGIGEEQVLEEILETLKQNDEELTK